MLLRFVRSRSVEGMDAREGFFCAAYELRERADLDPSTSDRLETLLAWFRQNLSIPDRFNRSKSKKQYAVFDKGLSWFKPTAGETLSKAFELMSLLEEHGYIIDIIRSDRIGYIVYEDEKQVVAEPFADTPK